MSFRYFSAISTAVLISFALILPLHSTNGYLITTPTEQNGAWYYGHSKVIRWTSVITDPPKFSLAIVNNNGGTYPLGLNKLFKTGVFKHWSKYVIPASVIENLPEGTGYQINIMSDGGGSILAQSPVFTVSREEELDTDTHEDEDDGLVETDAGRTERTHEHLHTGEADVDRTARTHEHLNKGKPDVDGTGRTHEHLNKSKPDVDRTGRIHEHLNKGEPDVDRTGRAHKHVHKGEPDVDRTGRTHEHLHQGETHVGSDDKGDGQNVDIIASPNSDNQKASETADEETHNSQQTDASPSNADGTEKRINRIRKLRRAKLQSDKLFESIPRVDTQRIRCARSPANSRESRVLRL